ncbi:hypothetical protein FHU36_005021 [Nonomuraea muscovyensis]|uniref:Uncharacterized protein n=1 Tax=Nonomuraea muscovyensis TaxID=1124761 RepID=A0A7X0C7E1_9ACTN|nr:hypothetical protein [Nonomuraea muscovyensis]
MHRAEHVEGLLPNRYQRGLIELLEVLEFRSNDTGSQ